MKNLLALALILAATNTAFATGGTHCEVDNKDVKISVNLVNGHGFGSPIVSNSSVDVTVKNGLVVGLAAHNFVKTHTTNEIPYWFNIGNELKLGAYAEPDTSDEGPIDAFVSLAVVIEAKRSLKSEETFVGKYTVIQNSNSPSAGEMEKKLSGKITCYVE